MTPDQRKADILDIADTLVLEQGIHRLSAIASAEAVNVCGLTGLRYDSIELHGDTPDDATWWCLAEYNPDDVPLRLPLMIATEELRAAMRAGQDLAELMQLDAERHAERSTVELDDLQRHTDDLNRHHARSTCPAGDGCALNKGAVLCFHCGRPWPPDATWGLPLDDRLARLPASVYSEADRARLREAVSQGGRLLDPTDPDDLDLAHRLERDAQRRARLEGRDVAELRAEQIEDLAGLKPKAPPANPSNQPDLARRRAATAAKLIATDARAGRRTDRRTLESILGRPLHHVDGCTLVGERDDAPTWQCAPGCPIGDLETALEEGGRVRSLPRWAYTLALAIRATSRNSAGFFRRLRNAVRKPGAEGRYARAAALWLTAAVLDWADLDIADGWADGAGWNDDVAAALYLTAAGLLAWNLVPRIYRRARG